MRYLQEIKNNMKNICRHAGLKEMKNIIALLRGGIG